MNADTIRELDALNMIEAAADGDRETIVKTVELYARDHDAGRLAASLALVAALTLVSGLPPREVLRRYRAVLLDQMKAVS